MSRLGDFRNLSSDELGNVSVVLDEKLKKIRQVIADFQLEATTLSYDEFQKRLTQLKAEHDRQLKECCALFDEMSRRNADSQKSTRGAYIESEKGGIADFKKNKRNDPADEFLVKGAKLNVPNESINSTQYRTKNKENLRKSHEEPVENVQEKISKMWDDFDLSGYVTELRNTERIEREERERRRLEKVSVSMRPKSSLSTSARADQPSISQNGSSHDHEAGPDRKITFRDYLALSESDEDSVDDGASDSVSVVSDTEFETARSRERVARKHIKRTKSAKTEYVSGTVSDEGASHTRSASATGLTTSGSGGGEGWRHRLTVPQPFSMTKREEAAGGYRAKVTRSMQRTLDDLKSKREEEDRELATQFRANPPPASIYVPLLANINARERERRETVRRNRAELLRSMEKPFSFTKRDAYRRAQRHSHEQRHTACRDDPEAIHRSFFNARPPPTFIYDDIAQRKRDEELARAYRLQMRAEELLRTSSLPHSMAMRAKTRHLTIGASKPSEKRGPKPEADGQAFQPQITKGVPNFSELHRRFADELDRRKKSRELTRPQPFSFCAEERLDQRSDRRRDADDSASDEEESRKPSKNNSTSFSSTSASKKSSRAGSAKKQRENTHSRTSSSLTDKQRQELEDFSKKESALRSAYEKEVSRLRRHKKNKRGDGRYDDSDSDAATAHVTGGFSRSDEVKIRHQAWQSYKEALEAAGFHGEPTRKRAPRPHAAYSQRDGDVRSRAPVVRGERQEGDLDSDEFFSDDGDDKWDSLK